MRAKKIHCTGIYVGDAGESDGEVDNMKEIFGEQYITCRGMDEVSKVLTRKLAMNIIRHLKVS